MPSRGNTLLNKTIKGMWLEGPAFLRQPSELWPKLPPASMANQQKKETDGHVIKVVSANPIVNESLQDVIDLNCFNSFKRLVMVTCYVKPFISNLIASIKKEKLITGEISTKDKLVIKQTWLLNELRKLTESQLTQFTISLGAFKDNDGIVRLKGRLEYSDLDFSAKFPVLVPKCSQLNNLLISDAHEKVLHGGMKNTLNELRTEYWLVQGR